jgi:hypothetical protein
LAGIRSLVAFIAAGWTIGVAAKWQSQVAEKTIPLAYITMNLMDIL